MIGLYTIKVFKSIQFFNLIFIYNIMVSVRKSRKRVLKSGKRNRTSKSRRLRRAKTRRHLHKRKIKRRQKSKRRRLGG